MAVAVAAVAAVASAVVVVAVGASTDGKDTRGRFWVGSSFQGLSARDQDGLVIYGTCSPPPDEGGCSPPLQIQNTTACARNPVAIEAPLRSMREERGALVADYGDGLDVTTGTSAVVIYGNSAARTAAALPLLRPRASQALPARLKAPVLPIAARRELVRVVRAQSGGRDARAVARSTGVPLTAVRTRLRMVEVLGPSVLRGVASPRRSWKAVARDRQISITAREESVETAVRHYHTTRAGVRRATKRTRGLTGGC